MFTFYRITRDKTGKVTAHEVIYQAENLMSIPEESKGEVLCSLQNENYYYRKAVNGLDVTQVQLKEIVPVSGPDGHDNEVFTDYVIFGPCEDAGAFKTLFAQLNAPPKPLNVAPPEPLAANWFPKKKKHFELWEFLSQPGTWTFVTLALILTGIFVPVAAPALILAAVITTGLAGVSLILSINRYVDDLWLRYGITDSKDRTFAAFLQHSLQELMHWADQHRMQVAIVAIAVGLLITAVVLTAGFFTGGGAFAVVGGALVVTGGGAFAFMAPLFTAIAAPFAAAAAAVGAEVSLAALAFTSVFLAVCCIPDVFRRIADWLDGFEVKPVGNKGGLQVQDDAEVSLTTPLVSQPQQHVVLEDVKGIGNPFSYVYRVFKGVGMELGITNPPTAEQLQNFASGTPSKLKND